MVVNRAKLSNVFKDIAINQIYININENLENINSIDELISVVSVLKKYKGYIFLHIDDNSDYAVLQELRDEGSAVIRIGFIGRNTKETTNIGLLIVKIFKKYGYNDVEWTPNLMGNSIPIVLVDSDIFDQKQIKIENNVTSEHDNNSDTDSVFSDISSTTLEESSSEDTDSSDNYSQYTEESEREISDAESERRYSYEKNNKEEYNFDKIKLNNNNSNKGNLVQLNNKYFYEEDMEEDMEEDIEQDIEEDIEQDMEQDMDQDMEQDMVQDTDQDMEQNIEQDIKQNIEQDMEQDIEQDFEESNKQHIKEDVEQDIEKTYERLNKKQINNEDIAAKNNDVKFYLSSSESESNNNDGNISDDDLSFPQCKIGCECYNCKSEREEILSISKKNYH